MAQPETISWTNQRRAELAQPLRQLAGLWAGMQRLGAEPVATLELKERLGAAVSGIERAHTMAGDGGISKGFSLLRGRWAPSYPETTGYTVPTLLNAAEWLRRPELRELAFALAEYLLASATPEGGVAHWQAASERNAIVFDTGQVMFGWLAAWDASRDDRYLTAARQAGDWLVSIQDASGAWKTHQHLGVAKVIDTRVAWALLELYRRVHDDRHCQAAVRSLEWARYQQDPDGWFRHCAFQQDQDPITHTLAYTAEGLFECGQILGEDRYIESARLTADAFLKRQRPDGSLAATFGPGWRETSRSSCLTGDCQMGRLWLCLYNLKGDRAYYAAAEHAILYVARTQNLSTRNLDVRGAIAGSQPIFGRYEPCKYPNWAAKFYVDALLTLDQADDGGHQLLYVG